MNKSKLFFNEEVNELINGGVYSDAVKLLFDHQLASWPQLAEVYSKLSEVKIKTFRINNFKLKLQFNPNRIASTSAKTDSESIKSRKCFLCTQNLPEQQLGINYHDEFIILCNPFPIFPEHLTITSYQHKPQTIKNHFDFFLKLTKHLSKRYSVIYNGPDCGASAPDHLHFQAGTKNILPIEDDIYLLNNEAGKVIFEDDQLVISAIDDSTRTMIFFESADEEKIINSFNKFYKCYNSLVRSENEPMFNIIGKHDEEFGWSIIFFLRSKHRPERFFRNDVTKLLVSPAAVDLGGLLITPREEDFNVIDQVIIKDIFNEVSLSESDFNSLIIKLVEEFR